MIHNFFDGSVDSVFSSAYVYEAIRKDSKGIWVESIFLDDTTWYLMKCTVSGALWYQNIEIVLTDGEQWRDDHEKIDMGHYYNLGRMNLQDRQTLRGSIKKYMENRAFG